MTNNKLRYGCSVKNTVSSATHPQLSPGRSCRQQRATAGPIRPTIRHHCAAISHPGCGAVPSILSKKVTQMPIVYIPFLDSGWKFRFKLGSVSYGPSLDQPWEPASTTPVGKPWTVSPITAFPGRCHSSPIRPFKDSTANSPAASAGRRQLGSVLAGACSLRGLAPTSNHTPDSGAIQIDLPPQ